VQFSRDDEFHMVFECTALSALRSEYTDLFAMVGGPDAISDECISSMYTGGFVDASQMHSTDMREFMDQQPGRVASFIHRALELRRSLPDIVHEIVLDVEGPEFQPQPGYSDTFSSDTESMLDASTPPPDSQELEDEWVEVQIPMTNVNG
jgi:hypothetical protein